MTGNVTRPWERKTKVKHCQAFFKVAVDTTVFFFFFRSSGFSSSSFSSTKRGFFWGEGFLYVYETIWVSHSCREILPSRISGFPVLEFPATGLIIFFRVIFVFIYIFSIHFFFSPLGVLFTGIYSVKHALHGKAGA